MLLLFIRLVVYLHCYCRLASTLATVSATSPFLDHVLIPLRTSRRRPTLAFVAAGCSVSTTCRWRTQVRMVSRNANPSVTPISNYTGVIIRSCRATPSILSHPIFLSTYFPLHLSSSSDIIARTEEGYFCPTNKNKKFRCKNNQQDLPSSDVVIRCETTEVEWCRSDGHF